MPTEILIFSRKHGRDLKTYGVYRSEHIMKFIFISIVVVLSCGCCASGELEIYPRLRYNLDDDRRFRLKKYEKPEFRNTYRLPFPLEEIRDRESFYNPDEGNLAERLNQLKKFEEVIDFGRIKLLQQHHRANPELNLKNILQYQDERTYKPSNLLEEARVYALDDDIKLDLDDSDEEVDGGNEENADILSVPIPIVLSSYIDISEKPQTEEGIENTSRIKIGTPVLVRVSANGEPSTSEEAEGGITSIRTTGKVNFPSNEDPLSVEPLPINPAGILKKDDDDDEDDDTTRRFISLKVMDDPSDFAFAPSDPRFYRKAAEEGLDADPADPALRTSNDAVSVTYRSEQKHQQMKTAPLEEDRTDLSPIFEEADSVAMKPSIGDMDSAGVYVIAIVAGISAAATVGLIAVGIGWYNLQKHVKNASDAEYPAYGVTGPNKDLSPSGDRRLAQSAQMYHYQHQKQQIIAMESAQPSFAISRAQPGERQGSVSDADSEEENEEGDYTVYECPGLAPTGEMEVKNPLFQDDPTPAQTPAAKNNANEKK